MTMTRTFHPVGQGLYCTERFVDDDDLKVNVVYDCGSDSLRYADLEEVIHASFGNGDEIDAVFISHFDSDHVKGLPILLNWCKVKKVFLPIVSSKAEVAYLRFKSLVELDKKNGYYIAVADRLLDPKRTSPEKVFEGFKSLHIPKIERIDEVTSELSETSANSTDDFGLSLWVFNMYNFKRFDRESDFRDILNEALLSQKIGVSLDDFIEDAGKVIQRLDEKQANQLLRAINKIIRGRLSKKEFRDRFGTINGNSMTLYSGPKDTDANSSFAMRCFVDDVEHKPGCLYLGDYEAKDEIAYRRMKSFYSKGGCWSRMGCVQLPHHGSKHNYNKDFDSEGICYVVSFGLGNRNHHPGKDVITNLLKNGRSVIFSTEANRYVHKNEIVQQVC